MSKGSSRRPSQVSNTTFAVNWDLAFGKTGRWPSYELSVIRAKGSVAYICPKCGTELMRRLQPGNRYVVSFCR